MRLIALTFLLYVIIGTGCAKKYDWKCTCEIYKADTTYVVSKDITNISQSDVTEQCAKYGESEAGTGGTHDCNAQVK